MKKPFGMAGALSSALWASALLVISSCLATDWFIDNAANNSANKGTNWSAAWTNFASIQWKSVQPGDTIWISGGATEKIYRENLSVGKSGADSNLVITIKNATHPGHSGRAVIDGSNPVLNWVKCAAPAEAQGNPHWEHLYKTTLAALPNPQILWTPLTKEYGAIAANLWQGTQALLCAQSPTVTNTLYPSVPELEGTYYSVPPGAVSDSTLVDPRLEALGGPRLVNAFLYIWGQPNALYVRRITAYDPGTHTLHFESLSALVASARVYTDRDTRYAIANNLSHALSHPGEFYLDSQTNSVGTHDLYLWPLNEQDPRAAQTIQVATRFNAINFSRNSHLVIEGLTLRYFANSAFGGAGHSSTHCTNLVIRNCEIFGGVAGGYGLSYLGYVDQLLFEHNYVHDTRWTQRGIVAFSCRDVLIRSNRFERIAGDGIYLAGVINGTVSANTFRDCLGVHANVITVYGPGCTNLLVERNLILNAISPLTLSECTDATYRNNVVNGGYAATFNKWAKCYGTLAFYNNTFVGNTAHNALGYAPNAGLTVVAQNNILDGGDGGNAAQRAHNLWVGTTGYQRDATWKWAPGEQVFTNLADLFVDPANHDYRLKPGSPAVGAGTNLNTLFTTDFEAKPRGVVWDIGACPPDAAAGPALTPPRRLRLNQ